jgi:ribonuclease-3
VLNLAVTAHLYPRLEAERFGAGRLTKIRAQAVSGRACRAVADRIGVPARLQEAAPPGVGTPAHVLAATERVLASVVEALIGACYLAFGYELTAAAVVEDFKLEIAAALEGSVDFKSTLQERLARDALLVSYEVAVEQGPPHDRTFEVRALVAGQEIGRGSGRSKKEAEQSAAKAALECT